MKLFKSTLLALLTASSLSMAGEATYEATGLGPWGYVFGYAGAAFGPEADAQGGGVTNNYDFDDSFIGGGGLGMYSDFLCGSRFEIEGLYSSNDLTTLNGASATGDISVAAVIFNLLKEFPINDRITGFAGGGLGYAGVDFNTTTGGNQVGSSASTVVYQLIVGADYCLSDCLSLFTQYKFLGIGESDWTQQGVDFENDGYISHNVVAGLRVSF